MGIRGGFWQLLLAALTLGPWLLLLVYDVLLYLWRFVTYELHGRRGRRPRVPSLTERPEGHKRRFSLAAITKYHTDPTEDTAQSSGAKQHQQPTTLRIPNDGTEDDR